MLDFIFEQFDERQEEFLSLWAQMLQEAAYDDFTFSRREEAAKAFISLLSALKKIGAHHGTAASKQEILRGSAEKNFFIEAARNQRIRGVTIEMSLGCIKAMRRAAETIISDIIATDSAKLKAQRLLCELTDTIELAILTDKQAASIDQNTRALKQANQQLTREKETYESIFETTSNLVLITDQQGNILEVNPEAKVFFSGQKIIGRFCGEIIGLQTTTLTDVLQRFAPDQLHEITLQSGDFSRVFNLQVKPLARARLAARGIMLILSDITCIVDHRQVLEQRVTERTQALANSEKMLDAIFQSVGKGIVLIDSDQEIVKANQHASEIYGIPLEILVGTSFCSLTDASGCQKLRDMEDGLVEGLRYRIEITSIYVDGSVFPSEIVMTRMDLDGQTFWPVIIRDISEQKALEDGLRNEKLQTEEMNVTLRNVLKTIESDRLAAEHNLTHRVRSSLLPGLEKIRKEQNAEVRSSYLNLLHEQLVALTRGFETELDADLLKLSKTELKVCRFIKAGLTGKEICDAMNLSFETIQTHRKNIRKKLGLSGKDVNLHTFLANRSCDLGGLDSD